jgi:hypothetical protein
MDTIPLEEKLLQDTSISMWLTFDLVATIGRSHVKKSFARSSSCQSVREGTNAHVRAFTFNVNNSTNNARFRSLKQNLIFPHSTGQLVTQHDKSVYTGRMLTWASLASILASERRLKVVASSRE